MKKSLNRLLIMAGGTGGHVFPGLAVAHYFREHGIDVHWMGTVRGLEARLVPEAQFPLHTVTIGGLRGKDFKTLLMAPFSMTKAILQARHIIKRVQPDMVIGMGGFVSGPGGIASGLMRCPLILHEQNTRAGLTNKSLAVFARKILEAFPGTFKPQSKVITVGNPIRSALEQLPIPEVRFQSRHSPLRLLVLGGSLGAAALNRIVPEALAPLARESRVEIIHQTGQQHFEETKKLYESMHLSASLKPFIEDMAEAYAWADMVLCRAGALTVSELCAVGLGAILVPFPYAVDDHQTSNAQFMVKEGAALCIQQSALTAARLTDIVTEFSQSPHRCLAMAQAAYRLRKINVAKVIFEICQKEIFL